jgi:hypothetical protein
MHFLSLSLLLNKQYLTGGIDSSAIAERFESPIDDVFDTILLAER